MKFTNVCLAVMLSLLVMVLNVNANPNDEPSVRGRVYNNCGFTVYMRQAIGEHPGPRPNELCRGFGETQEVAISPRTYFETPLPVYQDSCGHSIKVARTPGSREVYQYEFTWARENNKLWYNLSHNDGNPFVDVARQIGGPEGSTCSYIRCQAGENGDGCDDPLAPMPCSMIGTPIGYLC